MRDTIYRQAAIDALNKHSVMFEYYLPHEFYGVKQEILELPSAQQKLLKYTGESICVFCETTNCDGCLYEPVEERREECQ